MSLCETKISYQREQPEGQESDWVVVNWVRADSSKHNKTPGASHQQHKDRPGDQTIINIYNTKIDQETRRSSTYTTDFYSTISIYTPFVIICDIFNQRLPKVHCIMSETQKDLMI